MLTIFMDLQDAERWRDAIRRFMDWYPINANQWCKKADVPYSTLNGFMTGAKNNITYGTLEKLAKSLGVTVGMIMGEVGLRDSARQDMEAAPDALRKMLAPTDARLVRQVLDLDPGQKGILSGMLQALPSGRDEDGGSKPKTPKEIKK